MSPVVWLSLVSAVSLLLYSSRRRQEKRRLTRLPYLTVRLPQNLHWEVPGEQVFPFQTLEFGGQLVFGLLWLAGGVWGLWNVAHALPSGVPPASWPLLLLAPALLYRAYTHQREWRQSRGLGFNFWVNADEEGLFLSITRKDDWTTSWRGEWATWGWAEQEGKLYLRAAEIRHNLDPVQDVTFAIPLRALDTPQGRTLRQLLRNRARALA